MQNNNINICIIHYNTPLLTECLIKSINKYTPNCHIYIFDNSDREPFEYQQDNLTVFDNTKGQIIEFESWLKQFPKKGSVAEADKGRRISARHCISVDKCFDLINDNFLLLDSDILLKKDISNLFDEKYMFCGQLETNVKDISRLAPYLCFINVKKCKELNIRYFDKEKMHGLITGPGNWYDTGAAFYYHTNKFQHKIINLDDYIVHYKGASWDPNYVNNKKVHGNLSSNEWMYINRKYFLENENQVNKVIYTCITGNYEEIINPTYINPNFDYICFTDNINMSSTIWQTKPIPEELKSLSKVKQQRLIKICPHKYLSEYELSAWVDGSIDVLKDIDDFLDYEIEDDKSVYIPRHPNRDCIYDEVKKCIDLEKDTLDNISPQISRYKQEKFPSHAGLVQSGIIIRKHNDPYCIKLMDMWGNEVINGSHRDQLSFNYCLWKLGNKGFKYLNKNLFNSEYFHWYSKHNRTNKSPIKIDTYYLPNLNVDKKVIYTVAIGNKPAELSYKDPSYDYICFTDKDIESETWQIRPIPEDLVKLEDKRKKAILKICPHEYLKEYDLSIYVENGKMVGDLSKFELSTKSSVYMYSRKIHCIYKEAINCIVNYSDNGNTIRSQMCRYQSEKYPKYYGLVNTTFIIRLHNTPYCVELMNKWKSEVMKGSYMDQLSFNYCLWKIGGEGFSYIK